MIRVTVRLKAAMTTTAVVLVLTGCTPHGDDTTPDDHFTAKLDTATNTVSLPLDDFVLKGTDATTVEHANAAIIAECLAQRGLDFPRIEEDWDSKPPYPDGYFGLWSPTYAETIAYELPAAANAADIKAVESSLTESWWAQWSDCIETSEQLPLSTISSSLPPTVADKGRIGSLESAESDERWVKARSEWVACLSEAGVGVDNGRTMRPTASEFPDVERTTAMIDVACKTSTGLPEKLAAIVVEYETEFVANNRSELSNLRLAATDVLKEAKEVLRNYEVR